MRKLSQTLGLGLLSSLFLVIPACGDDGGGDTGTQGNTPGHSGTHSTHSPTPTSPTPTTPGVTTGTGTMAPGTSAGSAGTTAGTTMTTTGGGGTMTTTTTTGGTTDTTGGNNEAGQQAVEALIGELCAWSDRCCDSGEFSYIFGDWTKDVAACKTRMIAAYKSNDSDAKESERIGKVAGTAATLLRDLAFNVSSIRSMPVKAEVDRCAAYIKTLDCNEPLNDDRCEPVQDEAKGPCRLVDMFTGNLGQGELCNGQLTSADRDIECKQGFSCGKDDNSAGGNNAYVCVAKGLENQTCFPGADHSAAETTCEFGLYCDPSAGICKRRPTLGQPCSYKDYSKVEAGGEEIPCADPYACDPISKVCVQSCTKGKRCANTDSNCATGQSCLPYYYNGQITGSESFCGDLLGDGGRCNSQADCKEGFHCNLEWNGTSLNTTGRCSAHIQKDVECDYDFQCGPNRYCDNGKGDEEGAPPATKGTCDHLLGADAADDLCKDDGHRACFQGAKGCFLGEGNVYRCMSGTIDENDNCATVDSSRLGTYEYLSDSGSTTTNWDRINPPGDAWINNCATGICSATDNNDPTTVCKLGLGEGRTGCDYDTKNTDKDTCQLGLICVNDECVKPLAPGDKCDSDYNDFTTGATQPTGRDSFTKNLCNPDAKCEKVGNYHACTVVVTNKRVTSCDGKGSSPGF